ncbi:MAG: AAA family ATPase [Kiritimatiellia bacterium]
MKVTFIHTADWQIGKPFDGVEDPQKRALLQNERLAVLARIAAAAGEHRAEFVVVAGDVFDSPGATKATVAAACSAIGAMTLPVYVIPGNHDHGGAGGLWEQEFFLRERDRLAPNLHVLLKPEPVELEKAVLFPCPLLRRHEPGDPTAWLRTFDDPDGRFGGKARIVIAHGSVDRFGGIPDDEEAAGEANLIDLARLPEPAFDYIALGDWHGTVQRPQQPKAWYSGTPELDRFVKGGGHHPGNILLVEAERGQLPGVRILPTRNFGWHELPFSFGDDAGLDLLERRVAGASETGPTSTCSCSGWMARWASRPARAWSRCGIVDRAADPGEAGQPDDHRADRRGKRGPDPPAGDPLISRVAANWSREAEGAGPEPERPHRPARTPRRLPHPLIGTAAHAHPNRPSTNYRLHQNLEVRFNDAITLIGGPNESGKSTVVEALHRALFLKAKGNTEYHRAMQSTMHTGQPEVELVFEEDGRVWTLRKRFASNGTTTLTPQGGEALRGDEAEVELARLLRVEAGVAGKAVDTQWAHLWVWQGQAATAPWFTPGRGRESCGSDFNPGAGRPCSPNWTPASPNSSRGPAPKPSAPRAFRGRGRNWTGPSARPPSPPSGWPGPPDGCRTWKRRPCGWKTPNRSCRS